MNIMYTFMPAKYFIIAYHQVPLFAGIYTVQKSQ